MGILDGFINLFLGGNDPAAAKKKLLNRLAKDLNQNKYAKFFRTKTSELEPPFAKFLYDIYKVVSPAQVFLQNAAKSDQLKQITVDVFLDKELRALKEKLSASVIMEKAGTLQVKELSAMIKRDLSTFIAAFDNTRVASIDNCYNAILALSAFVSFDFFFILKKFDPALTERNFTYQPKFQSIKAADLTENIKDFMEFSSSVEVERDWKTALAVLKAYKEGMDVVNPDHWNKALRFIKDVGRTRIFEQIVQYITADPLWVFIPKLPDERMVDKVLEAKKTEIEKAISKIENDKKSAQIDQIAKTIFGTAEVDRLHHYTSKGSEPYLKKDFDGFTKTLGINYLKAYLLDFFKKGIRELCDLFIVRGQWSNIALSQTLSNAYHEMMDLAEQLNAFDESLSEKGDNGSRLRQAMLKVDRDRGQTKYIKSILRSVNNTAQKMINASATNLIAIGRSFKSLLDDLAKKPSELIMNWKEMELAATALTEDPVGKYIADEYKRMYYFVQLLQCFAGPVESDNPADQGGSPAAAPALPHTDL
jgi:hypothetical protein